MAELLIQSDARLCLACENLSRVFGTGPVDEVVRYTDPVTGSKNSLTPHTNIAETRYTCSVCKLLFSTLLKMAGRTEEQFLAMRVLKFARITLTQRKYEIITILTEIYGTGKLISHINARFFTVLRGEKPVYFGQQLLRVYSEYDNWTSKTVFGRPVERYAGCPRTLKLARDWINDCYQSHLECRYSDNSSTDSDPLLPARVLFIGKSGDNNARLLLSDGRRGKWAALSHRWPPKGTIKVLLTTNLTEMQNGFSPESLPPTFRDAIKITRALRISYLWIDSLCIIQDSPEDWNEQASQMAKIFKNSHVTIAAAATRDSLGGILVERDWAPMSQPARLPVPSEEGLGIVSIDSCIDENTGQNDANYLEKRAWCFQESRLSHRLLTFDRQQTSFTCLRRGLHEGRQTMPAFAREYRNEFLPHFVGQLSPTIVDLQSTLKIWYKILTDYTTCSLTYSTDKLVALSGIANVVGDYIQDKYYAGLWDKSFPQALLWSPYDEEDLPNPGYKATTTTYYRAPSWSWVSVDSRISSFVCRQSLQDETVSTVIEAKTTLEGPDVYGKVTGGYIVIRGPFKRAVRGNTLASWPQQPWLCWEAYAEQDEVDISHCVFDHRTPDVGRPIWCLQITNRYGLILLPVPGKDAYVRIGIFHMRSRDVNNIRVPKRFSQEDVRTVTII